MPPRGKESILRRRKEIERQQKQKEKQARRDAKRTEKGPGEQLAKDEISPDDLVSIEELTGLSSEADLPPDPSSDSSASAEASDADKPEDGS